MGVLAPTIITTDLITVGVLHSMYNDLYLYLLF